MDQVRSFFTKDQWVGTPRLQQYVVMYSQPKTIIFKKNSLFWWKRGELFCHLDRTCVNFPEMDRSTFKQFPYSVGILGGGFCHLNRADGKLHEMYRSTFKNISPFQWSRQWASLPPEPNMCEISWNGIDPPSNLFWWGRLFCHLNLTRVKFHAMHRSTFKNFPIPGLCVCVCVEGLKHILPLHP